LLHGELRLIRTCIKLTRVFFLPPKDDGLMDDADLAELDTLMASSRAVPALPGRAPLLPAEQAFDDSCLEDHEKDLVSFLARRGVAGPAKDDRKEEAKKEEPRKEEDEPPKSPQMGSKSPKVATLRNKLGRAPQLPPSFKSAGASAAVVPAVSPRPVTAPPALAPPVVVVATESSEASVTTSLAECNAMWK
jgi:hypothetical protein